MNAARLQRLQGQLRELADVPIDKRPMRFDTRRFATCGIGLISRDPLAQAEGFASRQLANGDTIPVYQDFERWEAVAVWFDIEAVDARELFYPNRFDHPALYDTDNANAPYLLADRIEQFLGHADAALHNDRGAS